MFSLAPHARCGPAPLVQRTHTLRGLTLTRTPARAMGAVSGASICSTSRLVFVSWHACREVVMMRSTR